MVNQAEKAAVVFEIDRLTDDVDCLKQENQVIVANFSL